MKIPLAIRTVRADDDLARLTELIHAAYAPQAAKGLRYWGTHQSVDDTRKRLASGHGLVAERAGEFVGTITVRPPQPDSRVELYRDPGTWTICQFAVAPGMKGMGLGKSLHDAAVAHALRSGGTAMALDTAAPAESLVAMYRAWGYQLAGEVDWRPHTNYVSVVMRKALSAGLAIAPASGEDLWGVAEVHVASWQGAYASILSPEYLANLSVEGRRAVWREVLAEGRSELLVAKDGASVIGFASFGPSRDADAMSDRGEVWAIYVHPRAWSAGVGRALWLAARERLAAMGFSSVSLWVIAGNERATRFYCAAGLHVEAGSAKEFELGGRKLREVRMVGENAS